MASVTNRDFARPARTWLTIVRWTRASAAMRSCVTPCFFKRRFKRDRL